MNSILQFPGRQVSNVDLEHPNLRLQIGEHAIDVGALRVITGTTHPRLTSKAIAVLLELVRNAGNTVTRDQLLDHVWKHRVTTPDVLTQAIKELRKAFGDDSKPSSYIETIPKVGYRLVAPVSFLATSETPITVADLIAIEAENDAQNSHDDPGEDSIASPGSHRFATTPTFTISAALIACGLFLAFVIVKARLVDFVGIPPPWYATDIRAITSDPGPEYRPHVSPDGTRIVYSKMDPASGFYRLYVRGIQPSRTINLTARTDANEELPVWSPDGTQIAFERLGHGGCKMFVVPSLGGTESEVGACRNHVTNYYNWTPDGKNLITADPGDTDSGSLVLERWNLLTGLKEPLQYKRSPGDLDLYPAYSPDGRWIAFRRGISPYSDLCVMLVNDGGSVRQLTHLGTRIHGYAWTNDNRALIFSSNYQGQYKLYTVDIGSGRINDLGVGSAEYPEAARTANTVVYEIPLSKNTLVQITIGSDSKILHKLAPSTGSDSAAASSPDGEQVAFVSDRSGSQQLWLYDAPTDSASPLTDYQNAVLLNPLWSQDGRALLVTVRRSDSSSLIEIDLATRRQRIVSKPEESILVGSYGPQRNSYLTLIGESSANDQLVFRQNAGTPQETNTVLASGIEHAEFDANARLVYYTKTANLGLFRRDLTGGAEQLVTTLVTSITMDGWRVVDSRIWYVSDADQPAEIREFDPASKNDKVIARVYAKLQDVNFSVSPSRKSIIMTPIGTEDTDVGAFQIASHGQSQNQ